MGRVRKPVIDNPVYSEIIITLCYEERYVSDLLEEMNTNVFFDEETGKIKQKTQPVLREQLMYLYENGYVDRIDEKKEGESFEKNKIFFKVKWDKIVEDFIDYIISYIGEDNLKDKESLDYIFNEVLKDKNKYINNSFLQDILRLMLDEFRAIDYNGVISKIFKYAIESNVFERIRDETIKNFKLDYLYDDDILFYEKLEEKIGKKKSRAFKVFDRFVTLMPSNKLLEFFEELQVPIAFNLLKEYYGEDKAQENFSESCDEAINALEETRYKRTVAEEDKSINKREVQKLIDDMEKIRKEELSEPNKYFKTKEAPKKIYDILVHIKKRFHFINWTDKYYLAYSRLRHMKKNLDDIEKALTGKGGRLGCFDSFGANFCSWMLDLASFYDIELDNKKRKEIEECFLKYRCHKVKE